MTDEEINQAIAAHVGAKVTKFYDWSGPGSDSWVQWPNYCADLNEMHRIEEKLSDAQYMEFYDSLYNLSGCLQLWHRKFLSATARLRAEAFLRTVGKWKE